MCSFIAVPLRIWILLSILLLAALSSCSGDMSLPESADRESSTFRAATLPQGSAEAAEIPLSTTSDSAGVDIRMAAQRAALDGGLFVRLSYDPVRYRFLGASLPPALQANLLQTVHSPAAGRLDFGAALLGSAPAAAESVLAGAELSFRFARQPEQSLISIHNRRSAASLSGLANKYKAQLDYVNKTLYVQHYNYPGDYNFDGLISVHDLVPLAVHWGEAAPKDNNKLLDILDSNDDGKINNGDLVPIGANYGARLTGYHIYHGEDLDSDYPEAAGSGPRIAADQTFVPGPLSSEDFAGDWPIYAFTLQNVDASQYYWASAIVDGADLDASDATCAGLYMPNPHYGLAVAPDGSSVSFRYTLRGDYNMDRGVGVTDLTPVGQHFAQSVPDLASNLYQIDGSGNGKIGSFDVLPMLAMFYSHVDSFNVYASISASDIPQQPDEASSIAPIGNILAFDGFSGAFDERGLAELSTSLASGTYVWVRPEGYWLYAFGGVEGAPSEVVQVP